MKTGQFMIEQGLITPEDLALALDIQAQNKDNDSKGKSHLLGMILCELDLITPLENYYILKKHNKLMSLMDRLIEKKMAPRSQLEKAEAEATGNGIPFISFLLEKQIIPRAQLQQILFELFGIPLRPVSDIIFDQTCRSDLTCVVDKDLAEKLKMIPLHLSGNILTIGITEPDNLIVVRKLDLKFPQYRFFPVFIPFSGFRWFYPFLYPKAQPASSPLISMQQLPTEKKGEISAGPEAVSDPKQDKEAIARLFKKYETLRLGYASWGNYETYNYRLTLFTQFIRDSYYKITAQNRCKTIEFYIRQQGVQAMIIAKPAGNRLKGEEISL